MRHESSIGRQEHRTLYVVDDDSDLRRSLQYLLEVQRIAVSPYSSGEHFLSEIDHLEPSPIILDMRMPGMDGTQVLEELARRRNKWPVVVLSGNGDTDIAAKALKLGAVGFLEKPVRSTNLLQAIDEAFERLANHGDEKPVRRSEPR